MAKVEVGQVASVTPAGADKALAAKVTWISTQPSDSSSTTSYPVVVTLDDSGLDLPSGGTASVAIVVGTASDVVTVPTSAVSNGTVTVLTDGTPSRVRVTTGVVGGSRTEIASGLKAGQQVVLADLDEALPSGDSSTTQRRFGTGGLGGGFTGGGGFPGGGAPGGGFGGR
jgi:HlyD family secretion protein